MEFLEASSSQVMYMKFARAQVRQMLIKFARGRHVNTAKGKNIGMPAAEDSSVTPVLKSCLHDAVLQLLSINFLKDETQCLENGRKVAASLILCCLLFEPLTPLLGIHSKEIIEKKREKKKSICPKVHRNVTSKNAKQETRLTGGCD